jgi:hypothetical protein
MSATASTLVHVSVPIEEAIIDGDHVLAASALGDSASIDLSVLGRDYGSLMRGGGLTRRAAGSIRAGAARGVLQAGPKSSGGGSYSMRYVELLAKALQRDAGGGGELGQLVRILEVVAPQRDHVAPRDRVARRADVDEPDLRPAGLAIDHVANGIGHEVPPCIEIMAAFPARGGTSPRSSRGRACTPCRTGWVGAAELVADVLGDDRRLEPNSLSAPAPRA